MAKQIKTGKAFEYSILTEFNNRLKSLTNIQIVKNEAYLLAKNCFDSFSDIEKDKYRLIASFSVNFLIDLEPRLSHGISEKDILQLEIASDKMGQRGDVRDVLFIRSLQKWEIGISAKNNHRALKHSRLSAKLDFGKEWLGIPCSEKYFEEIAHVFDKLKTIRSNDKMSRWDDVFSDKLNDVYVPVLKSFKKEMLSLRNMDTEDFAARLVSYLVGKNDFYKLIKSKKKLEIQAFNMHGTLNQPYKRIKPKASVSKLKLPNRLIELSFKKDHGNTLLAYFDEGWQISFRIHSASSKVESSLKFDINLVSSPHKLFVNHILIND